MSELKAVFLLVVFVVLIVHIGPSVQCSESVILQAQADIYRAETAERMSRFQDVNQGP